MQEESSHNKVILQFPAAVVETYRQKLQLIFENVSNYSDIEQAEAFESLGVALCYNGQYGESVLNLTTALSILRQNKEWTKDRKFHRLSILASICYFRLGSLTDSERLLSPLCAPRSRSIDPDIVAIACINMCNVRLNQRRYDEGIERAVEAVELASHLYPRDSAEYLRYVRVLIVASIRAGEYNRAESLVDETKFSRREKAVLTAGCRFACGNSEEALVLLRSEKLRLSAGNHTARASAIDVRSPADTARSPGVRRAVSISRSYSNVSADPHAAVSHAEHLQNILVLYNLAVIYLRKYKIEEANECFAEALEELNQYSTLQQRSWQIEAMSAALKQAQESGLVRPTGTTETAAIAGRLGPPHPQDKTELPPLRTLSGDESEDCVLTLDAYEKSFSTAARNGGTLPFVLSADEMISPHIFSSHLLLSEMETEFISAPLTAGASIQSGKILCDPRDEDPESNNNLEVLLAIAPERAREVKGKLTLNEVLGRQRSSERIPTKEEVIYRELKKPIAEDEPFFAALPVEVAAAAATSGDGSSVESSSSANIQATSRPVSSGLVNELAPDDRYASVCDVNFDVTAAADMADNYLIAVELASGQPIQMPSVASKAVSILSRRYGVLETKGKVSAPSRQPAKLGEYVSSVHDTSSVHAEIFPLSSQFGRDDVTCWVQWALAQSGGFGFGFMGTASLNTSPDTGMATFAGKKDTSAEKKTLENVFKRLSEQEKLLEKSYDDERKYRPGDREKLFLLVTMLAKLSTQLFQRKEAGHYVKRMEEIVGSIDRHSDHALASASHPGSSHGRIHKICNYDPYYLALVRRFRLDFEEWDISEEAMTTAKKRLGRYIAQLATAKDYLACCQMTGNIQFQRDAIKRLANVYIDIHNAPLVDKDAPKKPRQPTDFPEKIDVGTTEMLEQFSLESIEELEREDPVWVKQFAKARAAQFIRKLRDLKVKKEED